MMNQSTDTSVPNLRDISTQFSVSITIDNNRVELDEATDYYVDARNSDVTVSCLITKSVLDVLNSLESADTAVIHITRFDGKMVVLGSHSIEIDPSTVSYGSSVDNNNTYVLEFVMIE